MAKRSDQLEIHFILDGIDMESVVFKDFLYGDRVTSVELRYVYRNWDELKENVIFFENNERVDAPWIKDPELWKNYQPTKSQELNKPELKAKPQQEEKLQLKEKLAELKEPKLETKQHKQESRKQMKNILTSSKKNSNVHKNYVANKIVAAQATSTHLNKNFRRNEKNEGMLAID
ncbi:MAG: hypothetical protein IC227_08575 [Enterococcus lacertideformus]|uniref:Uncharacterized protein n=1 Tax=Enterococcus lacertideformus TaxID=2771493 RepID=A0A931B0W5_9ENTE|nr:hypothetical protein [Enterococcus lacertideformus]